MKAPSNLVILACLAANLVSAASSESIQRAVLDDRVVVVVSVATNRVTTISFPSSIAALDGAGVSADPKIPGVFQLAHTKGSSFLSLRATTRGAASNLNIRWNRRTYVFELVESNVPVLALNLEERVTAAQVQPAPAILPTRLLALLDKAKAFPLLRQQHPEAVAQVEARTFAATPEVTDFNDYEIQIQEIFRFNPEDTLVFHVRMRNKSERELRYRPDSFAVRVGDRLYHQSISDASGVLPPKGEMAVYFALTGTPDGARAELSLKNDFSVLVTRTSPEPQDNPQPRPNEVSAPQP